MALFGCASDEQFLDELHEEIADRDFEYHYCEYHDSYYCEAIDFCNPKDMCYPAMSQCRLYRGENDR